MRILLAALTLLATPVLAEEPEHKFEAEGVIVLHPWAKQGPEGLQIFMEVENTGQGELVLKGGASPDGTAAALVGASIKAGESSTTPIPAFPIPAGAEVDFEADSAYLLLKAEANPGDHLDLLLTLEPIGTLEIEVEVFDADTDQHPHAGHNH